MNILIEALIFAGSALMVYNIVRYCGFLEQVRKMDSLAELGRPLTIPLALLIGFLAGYLAVGFLGKPDIVVALILSGGSLYVSLVLHFIYRIVAQVDKNDKRLGALYAELRSNLDDLTKDSLSVFRVNLTKDVIEERGGSGLFDSDRTARSYTELVAGRREQFLTDRSDGQNWGLFSREGLLWHFQEGHTTAEDVVFCRTSSHRAFFVKRQATLATQPSTGDVAAFITERPYNDEMVVETLLKKALVGQYDMIAYLVDGRYGVVIGNRGVWKKGRLFPGSNDGLYDDYVRRQLAPVLCGTDEEQAAVLAALDMDEIERRLRESEPYEVGAVCRIDGETRQKRFVFYTVNRAARFYILLESSVSGAGQSGAPAAPEPGE